MKLLDRDYKAPQHFNRHGWGQDPYFNAEGFFKDLSPQYVETIEHEATDDVDLYIVKLKGGGSFNVSVQDGKVVYLQTYEPVHLCMAAGILLIAGSDNPVEL